MAWPICCKAQNRAIAGDAVTLLWLMGSTTGSCCGIASKVRLNAPGSHRENSLFAMIGQVDQAFADGSRRRLATIRGTQLGQDVRDVDTGGLLTYEKLCCNLPVSAAPGEEIEDLLLTRS